MMGNNDISQKTNPQSILKRIAFSLINIGQSIDPQWLSFFSMSHGIILLFRVRALRQSVSLFSPGPLVQVPPPISGLGARGPFSEIQVQSLLREHECILRTI
jgi:hypothetical protein